MSNQSMGDPYPNSLSRRKWLASAAIVAAGASLPSAQADPAGSAKIVSSESPGTRVYDIRAFGAKGDGVTLDTAALQAAIDACHQDQGGTVLVPAGVFVIGTTELKSNITLHIAAQGKLLGVADVKQYFAADNIPLQGDATLEDGNVGLLFAVDAENVTVEGPGKIDGQGLQFRPGNGKPPPAGNTGTNRPYHLLFHRCKHLRVHDIFLKDSAYHSVRIIQSSYVYLDGIRIQGRVVANNDGFHFVSCEYVHLTNSDVQAGDDACALFGSCKFVTVTNCTFSTRWSVFRFGGGVVENITISNCIINEVYGCPIKMRCTAGSRFENISFANLVMNNVTGPISLGLEAASGSLPQPIVRNISFNGIRATVTKPLQLKETDFHNDYQPGEIFSCITLNAYNSCFLENISFNDVHITFPGGGTEEQASVRNVPKVCIEYYTIGVPPAYALFARNVRGLTLQNIRFDLATPDLRPAVVFDHVSNAGVNGFTVQGHKNAESVLRFIESQDVLLSAVRLSKPSQVFLQVEGATSEAITVDGGDISKAVTPVAFKHGAAETSVKLRT